MSRLTNRSLTLCVYVLSSVKGVKTSFLSVQYHLWQGRVHCCLATDKPRPGHTPFAEVHPGDVVRARVVGMRKKEIKR